VALVGIFAQGTFVAAKQGPGVIVLPIYRATAVLLSIMALLLFWVSTHLLPPRRGRRFRAVDWVLLALLVVVLVGAYLVREWWIVVPS
jgi:hypothetical protein